MMLRAAALVGALAVAMPMPAQAVEGGRSFEAEYSFTLYGLPIGRSTFRSTISGDAFSIDGTIASAGLARLFDSTKGTTSASGRFASGVSRPDSYSLSYTSGRKAKRTDIAFANGSVTSTQTTPKPKPRPATWKPLDKRDLVAVADPISGTLIRAASPDEVCNRTLKLYDGEMRADLKLSAAGRKPLKTNGFDGDAVVCRAAFVPISGYKAGDKTVEFLKTKGRIVIQFAEMADTGVYAPVHLSTATEIGTLTMTAQRFGPAP